MPSLESIFRSDTLARDKLLSRVFGIFNEEIVRCWCNDPRSAYQDLGRPTLTDANTGRYYTLDFAFRKRDSGCIYVGEMKCELEYENYRYLTLDSPSQLRHHKGNAFKLFLASAISPTTFRVNVQGKLFPSDGAILVWGRSTQQGQDSVIKKYGLHTVLTVENIVKDLLHWQSKEFEELIATKGIWCIYLFAGLREPDNMLV